MRKHPLNLIKRTQGEILFVIALTVGAIVLSAAVNILVGIGTIKAVALFPGLEGTALLASAGFFFGCERPVLAASCPSFHSVSDDLNGRFRWKQTFKL